MRWVPPARRTPTGAPVPGQLGNAFHVQRVKFIGDAAGAGIDRRGVDGVVGRGIDAGQCRKA